MQTVSVGRAWAGWRVNRCVPQSTTKCCLKSSEFSKRGENLSINDACMCTCVCVCVCLVSGAISESVLSCGLTGVITRWETALCRGMTLYHWLILHSRKC